MQYKVLSFTTFLAFSILLAGCSGPAATPNSSNVNSANTNVVTSNANSPLGTTKKPEAETSNNAPTLAPVVVAFYDALKKKDDAGVRSVMSQEYVRSAEADMKAEKKSGLAAYLAESEQPDKPVEVRNEKIEGNNGVAEIRGSSYKNWTPFGFVNEGGKWKYTGTSPDIQAVKQASNSNK